MEEKWIKLSEPTQKRLQAAIEGIKQNSSAYPHQVDQFLRGEKPIATIMCTGCLYRIVSTPYFNAEDQQPGAIYQVAPKWRWQHERERNPELPEEPPPSPSCWILLRLNDGTMEASLPQIGEVCTCFMGEQIKVEQIELKEEDIIIVSGPVMKL